MISTPSRVLPGFEPDSKIRMLAQMKDSAEVIIAINAADIEKNKVRGDLGHHIRQRRSSASSTRSAPWSCMWAVW